MAFTNYSRSPKFNQKRSISYLAIELTEAAVANAMTGEIGVVTGNELVAKLPPNAIIQDAYVFVRTASNAATSAAFTVGTADGGAQILSAVNAKILGKQGTFAGASQTGTGVSIYVNRTITGAATAVGKYVLVIEYLEYTKTSGELTNLA